MRLTWHFCESFEKPTDEELETYSHQIENWASSNSLIFPSKQEKKPRKRKLDKTKPQDDIISDSCSSEATIISDVPIEKDVQLPIMDESPILTSIIKNFEISPEPILTRASVPYSQDRPLPNTQTQPTCSYDSESSVILSFMQEEDKPKPSTSRSESEDFILNLI